MPARLTENQCAALRATAYDEMTSRQQETVRTLRRMVAHKWEYRDGKKTAVKVGVGLSIGMGFVILGAATHGVGVPVVIGLAVAGMAASTLTDTAFAKLWGRDKTGVKRTWRWKADYEPPNTAGETKDLEERMHKTIRRASQHYLSAWLKAQEIRQAVQPLSFKTCDEVNERLKAMLPVLRPMQKAWLYIQPAIYLSQSLLEFCDGYQNGCREELNHVGNSHWHPSAGGCGSPICYQTTPGIRPNNVLGIPLWQDEEYGMFYEILGEVKGYIDACIDVVEVDPKDPFNFRGPWAARVHGVKLYDSAAGIYDVQSKGTKVWHGVINGWERKTATEKATFVFEHFTSVAIRAGTLGAGIGFDAFGSLFEIGGNFLEEAIEVFPEGDHDDDGADESIEKAAALQDSLRSASLHLCEVFRIAAVLEESTAPYLTCDEAVKYCRKLYQIMYHISEAQQYLQVTIAKVANLSRRISEDCAKLKEYNAWVRSLTIQFLDFESTKASTEQHKDCSHTHCILKV